MAVEFANDHGKAGIDVFRGGRSIAWIRYSRGGFYIVHYEDDASLNISEMESILAKIEELTENLAGM